DPAQVDYGDTSDITVTPAVGWHIVSVVDSEEGPQPGSYTTTPVTANRTVTATFAINTYTITCDVTGNGTCVADPATVDHGDTSDITVTPAVGWHIVSVVDSVEGAKTGSYTTTEVTANRTVTATFALVVYVDQNATSGAQTGESWEDAYLTIQDGINGASGSGAQVWVMQGTYVIGAPVTMATGVKLYGGFDGSETTLDARDIQAHETVVDGNSGVYHVLHLDSLTDTVVDGFTIMGGLANGIFPDNAAAGILCSYLDATNTVSNCVIRDNTASQMAGGIGCLTSSPLLKNLSIVNNSTPNGYGGGGMGVGYNSSPMIINCLFQGNTAMDPGPGDGGGGGLGVDGNGFPTLINCVFLNNAAGWEGGGIAMGNATQTTLINCTFYGNSAPSGGGAFRNSSHIGTSAINCILWDNSPDEIEDNGTAIVTYSDVQGGYGGPGDNNIDANPLFVNPAAGDLRLASGSPCINSADTASGPDYDFLGVARPQGAGSDMGAYEYVPIPVVGSLAINGGAATTADPEVTLDNTATENPTEYMASESSDFSGASWQAYDTAPTFTLSSGEGGTKTVYFKVRNAGGESAPVSDTIHLIVEQTILLPGDVPLELVWVPSGSFQMGRYPGEADSDAIEDPQHSVALAYGFWMGKYEVTQEQWLAVRGSWPGTAPSSTYGVGDSYPAYYISWDDAKDFITSLNAHIVSSGQGPLTVRLPSEAEWEYACRAGTQTRFYFGESLGCAGDCSDCAAGVLPGNRTDYMWYCGNNGASGTPTYGTKLAGGKLPNGFGLYDMSGNVYEWCEDDYHASYTGAPADGSAWIESPRASYRMIRGGYWISSAWYCRSAFRCSGTPSFRGSSVGFRLAAVQ
ncbi:MAG TPA: SUMF1/EgtB/PvdO family nonheme iron enzyme, partial [Candidatus Hydrogenedentes bacterium]|nr:SUMF1/EgtB/PvdO family nonheme iron enzyme [Candidatus Hydrogenedentota bacterium]HPG68984.1 SUMF1/EgtB/PvdO family nonheme iron enzyme [Candidatus Hydrogenedentota bacterium]